MGDLVLLAGVILFTAFCAVSFKWFCLTAWVFILLGGLFLIKMKQQSFFSTFSLFQEAVEARQLGFSWWGKRYWKLPFAELTATIDDLQEDFEFSPRRGKLTHFRDEGLILLSGKKCYHLPLHQLPSSAASHFRDSLEEELGEEYDRLEIDLNEPELPEALAKELDHILSNGPEKDLFIFMVEGFALLLGISGLFFLGLSLGFFWLSTMAIFLTLLYLPCLFEMFWERSKLLDHQLNWARLYLIVCLAREAREGTVMVTGELRKHIPFLAGFLSRGKRRQKDIDFSRLKVTIE